MSQRTFDSQCKNIKKFDTASRNELKKKFLEEREISYLKMSGFNIYEDGFHYKDIGLSSNDSSYRKYYNKFKENNSIMNSMFAEYMTKNDFLKFQKEHKSCKPFWDSIVAMFLFTLNKLYRVHLDESFKKEIYADTEDFLNRIVDIVSMLPDVKRDIFLKRNAKTIKTIT